MLLKIIARLSIILLVFGCSVSGCISSPHTPDKPADICKVFEQNPKWYRYAYATYRNWGIPVFVSMAIIYQESRFNAKAKPERTTCLFIFPGPRPSSAYGYAQALDETWDRYRRDTDNWGADRDDFGDAIDFIGWYCHQSHIRCHIPKTDAYKLYLAYHEGQGGFNRKSYTRKKHVMRVAQKVAYRADVYRKQLAVCEDEFSKTGPCCLFPFLF